jgi:hypothetical protein
MTEAQRDWIQWAILFLIVYFAAYLVQSLTYPVLYWLSACVHDVLRMTHASPRASFYVDAGTGLCAAAIRFAALGFAYRWLMGDRWRKAGLSAWLVVTMLDNARLARPGSPMFYLEAAVSCAAALAGARLAMANGDHPWYRDSREWVLHKLAFEK